MHPLRALRDFTRAALAGSVRIRRHRAAVFLVLCAMTTVIITATATLRSEIQTGQGKGDSSQKRKAKYEDERWPAVDYDAPETPDLDKRSKRRVKNTRHDKKFLVTKPSAADGEMNLINDWEVGFPALPVDRSDLVIIGVVTGAQAYLSNDKTGIYSEFLTRVETVLKGDGTFPLTVGGDITVERVGGRVKLPSGHTHQYGISKQGMPKKGGRYLLFLRGNGQEQNFSILTGYELKDGQVFPLDGVDPADGSKLPQFAEYEKAEEQTFLNIVRAEVGKFSQGRP